ncbi:MAG: alpha/beta hydrolase [Xanthobacteraceae bacterium]|nr:alpha/beta hydrolase [Xanthobacteraceae bacterium]
MTTVSQSEPAQGSHLSRRHIVQALTAGAAATVAAPALANESAVVAEANDADYVRDPARWGSPEVAALFPGFKHLDIRTKGAIIRVRHGGSGPPMLLLHGNPNNHVLWYAVAARLAQHYHVVLADLRGYGDSSLPDPGPNLVNYSFRVMAEDMLEVMESLGHQRFFLVGHDRGARLSHRLCLDHPDRVMKLCLLDMLPNYHVWTNANMKWGLNTWHWLFMAQPEPFPETMMSAVPAEWFLTSRGGNRHPPKVVMDEYIRCFTKKTIYGSCRDYRAGATIDFAMDSADKDRQIGMPLLVLWGTRGQPPTQEFPTVWKKYASNLVDAQPLATGHYLQEEAPDQVYDYFMKFFTT